MLRYPHYRGIFCSLSHLLSTLLHWKIWSMSSVVYPPPIGSFSEVHAPLFPITVHVESFPAAIIVSHMCIGLGTFFVVICSNSQST